MTTGAYIRFLRDGEYQILEIDELTDDEFGELEKDYPDRGWMWTKFLAKWIRDNVETDKS